MVLLYFIMVLKFNFEFIEINFEINFEFKLISLFIIFR